MIELQCVIDGSAIRARDIPGMTRAAGAIGWAVLVHGPQGTSVHADAFVVRDKAYRSIQTHELYAFAHAARLTQGLGVPARKLCIQTDDNRFQRANQFMASDQDSVLRDVLLRRLQIIAKDLAMEMSWIDEVLRCAHFDVIDGHGGRGYTYVEHAYCDHLARAHARLAAGTSAQPALSFDTWLRMWLRGGSPHATVGRCFLPDPPERGALPRAPATPRACGEETFAFLG